MTSNKTRIIALVTIIAKPGCCIEAEKPQIISKSQIERRLVASVSMIAPEVFCPDKIDRSGPHGGEKIRLRRARGGTASDRWRPASVVQPPLSLPPHETCGRASAATCGHVRTECQQRTA